jgi:hypothetical protein
MWVVEIELAAAHTGGYKGGTQEREEEDTTAS